MPPVISLHKKWKLGNLMGGFIAMHEYYKCSYSYKGSFIKDFRTKGVCQMRTLLLIFAYKLKIIYKSLQIIRSITINDKNSQKWSFHDVDFSKKGGRLVKTEGIEKLLTSFVGGPLCYCINIPILREIGTAFSASHTVGLNRQKITRFLLDIRRSKFILSNH